MNLNKLLEEEKDQEELKVLIAETRELNELMRSYIKVQMDKDSINHQAVLKEIQAIEETSKKAQEQMISTLEEQKNISENQLVKMQEVSENYLNQMQEQERLSRRKLENLNEQIVENSKEGLNVVNQGIGKTLDNLEKGTNQTLNGMNKNIQKLGKNIENTSFDDKLKTALPLAVIASIITLLGYGLINLIDSFI